MTDSGSPQPVFHWNWPLAMLLATALTACHVYETESFRRLALAVAGACAVGVWLVGGWKNRILVWPSGAASRLALCFAGFVSLQALRSLNPYAAVTGLTLAWGGAIACLLSAFASAREQFRRLLPNTVPLIAVVVALAGIWQSMDFVPFECMGRAVEGYAPSLFGHGNNGGTFASVLFPLTIACAMTSAGLPRRLLGWTSVSLLAWYIIVSHSRAGLIAALMSLTALGCLFAFHRFRPSGEKGTRNPRMLPIVAGLIVLGFALALFVTKDAVQSWVGHARSSGSVHDRLTMWRNGLSIAREYPILGAGLGNFRAACYAHRSPEFLYQRGTEEDAHFFGLSSPHNMYVLTLAEVGPAGLILFVAPMILALVRFCVRWKAGDGDAWDAAFAALLVAFGVAGAFNSLSISVAQSVLAWLAIGFLSARSVDERILSGFQAAVAVAAGSIVLVFFGVAAAIHSNMIRGRHQELEFLLAGSRSSEILRQGIDRDPWNPNLRRRLGRLYLDQGQPSLAEEQYRQIIQWEPDNPHAWLNLGEALRLLRRTGEAADCFERSTTLAPSWPYPRMAMARMALDRGDFALAHRVLSDLIAIDPGWPYNRYDDGIALANLGEYEKAASRFRQAMQSGLPVWTYLKQRTDPWLSRPEFAEFFR